MKHILISIGLILIVINSFGQEKIINDFPHDFNSAAFSHIKNLASFGLRTAQSESEKLTSDYIRNFMNQNNIDFQIDSFDYKMYKLDSLSILIKGNKIKPKTFLINPYQDQSIGLNGFIFHVDSTYNWYWRQDLKDKIVICSPSENPYRLALHRDNPKSVIQLEQVDFENIKENHESNVEIQLYGNVDTYKTVNLISVINPEKEKEIILTAHWDSYIGVGAADNASGVGVLLETSKFLNQLKDSIPFKIKIVFFGAEELGKLGSKSFVTKYAESFNNCRYVINVDNVGGGEEIGMEMRGGVKNAPKVGEMKLDSVLFFYSRTDLQGKWNSILDEPYISIVPDWFRLIIENTVDELGMAITPLNQIGSDHQSFYLAGVPATSIVKSGGSKTHCKEDLPEQINFDGLEKIGKIITLMILDTN
jgi:hypothetical protein